MMIQSTPLKNIGKPTVLRTKATITAATSGGNTIQKVYDLGSEGGKVTATAENGLGNSLTQEATISSSGNYASGSSATQQGTCSDCKLTCFQSCGKVCTAQKESGTSPNCSTNCIGGCKSTCSGNCGTKCTNNCSGECDKTCDDYCGRHCWDACSYGCGVECVGQCSGECGNGNCGTNCKKNGGGGCFVGNTRILTGKCVYKNIEDIEIGDSIIAYDENNKTYSTAKVINTQCFTNKADIVEIKFSNGTSIQTTTSHPFLTTTGWKALDIEVAQQEHKVHVELLQINDEIITNDDEHVFVTKIKTMPSLKYTPVYNIDVQPYHTYLVENIVVHNANVK